MKPVEFPEQTVVFAKDQPEYIPLPAHIAPGRDVAVTSCWQLTWRERLRMLRTGRVYFTALTFGSPLQPQIASTLPPAVAK